MRPDDKGEIFRRRMVWAMILVAVYYAAQMATALERIAIDGTL